MNVQKIAKLLQENPDSPIIWSNHDGSKEEFTAIRDATSIESCASQRPRHEFCLMQTGQGADGGKYGYDLLTGDAYAWE